MARGKETARARARPSAAALGGYSPSASSPATSSPLRTAPSSPAVPAHAAAAARRRTSSSSTTTPSTPSSSSSSSRLPSSLRFVLVVLMSFSISALLYSLQGTVMDYELATISRKLDGWEFTAGVLGWKLVELGISWYGGFDDLDLAALTILTHTPYLYLIHSFYNISLYTTLSSLVIDILAVSIPTRLLRSRSPTHSSNAPTTTVPNRNLIHDSVIVVLTSLLGASVYASTIYASLKTFLPVFLVTYFDGLRTVEPGYNATLPLLTGTFLPLGWAVRIFLLDPSLGYEARLTEEEEKKAPFNPETATLGETVRYNLWGYEKRTRVLLGRTAALVSMILISTTMQVYGRIEGAEPRGALGYAGLWVLPGVVASAFFEWVGGV